MRNVCILAAMGVLSLPTLHAQPAPPVVPTGTVRISGSAKGSATQLPKHPASLWGSPYDRSLDTLGIARVPPPPLVPEPFLPQSLAAWLKQKTFTGNWGGERVRLDNEGIDFVGRYFQETSGNPVGGSAQALRYAHEVAIGADVNFAQLTGTNYGMLHVLITERAGLGLVNTLPALDSPQEIYGGGQTVRLSRLSWEREFGRYLETELGWMNTEDEFAQSNLHWGLNLYCQFQSDALCGVPEAVYNNAAYSYYPTAVPAARIRLFPFGDHRMMIAAGIYSADPTIVNSHNGWKLGLHGATGTYIPLQVGWHFGGTDTKGALPTNIVIGGYRDSSEVDNVVAAQLKAIEPTGASLGELPAQQIRGRFGGWVQAEHMLQRDAHDPARGTVAFATFIWGDPRTAISPYYVTFGLVRHGTFASRPDDTFSIGGKLDFVNRKLANYVSTQQLAGNTTLLRPSSEHAVEMNYGWHPAGWLLIRPGLQYYWHPGGTNRTPNALLLDLETGVTF